MDATEHLLRTGGLAAVTTQAVARETGLAEGTLYRHFEGRDDLVASTIRERLPVDFDKLLEDLIGRAGQGDVETNLREFITNAIPFFGVIAPFVGMLAAHPPLAARHFELLRGCGRGPRHSHEQVATYFREEQRLGRVQSDIDAKAAAALVLGMCFERKLMAELFGEDPTGLTDEELPSQVAAILTRGLNECVTTGNTIS